MAAKKKTKRGKTTKSSKSSAKQTKAKTTLFTASNSTPSNSTQADSAAAKARFPVVGIGASAGGLDGFKRFFSALPADADMAFVLLPHLDPTHKSLMVELLSKQTSMPVCEAEHGMAILTNHVYIVPPNKYLAIHEGLLQLSMPNDRCVFQTAIDFFFRSLADDLQERAIGIILAGTGSHGAYGLKEIKLAGGMVMVQEPESAEYDQMPRSAIATGLVDYVLPPEEMPAALVGYARHPYMNSHREPAPTDEAASDQLSRVLTLLRTRTKYDFGCYRKNMLTRRVQRRMGLCHIDQLTNYLTLLQENSDEVTALYKDLLIGVTGFFREAKAFQVLQQRVIPELVERADVDISVRVWVPGCATGEEAYSISIVLLEQFAAAGKSPNIQVFATDIDEDSLERGRRGIYPESVTADLSPERLKRFFVKVDDQNYEVNKQLRESVVFAPQSLIGDAPFSKLDLVSCRNLLIYLEPEVQQKVISLFHFALGEGRYLMLGSSETIGRRGDLFEPISKKWRIFRRIGPVRPDFVEVPIVSAGKRHLKVPRFEPAPRPSMGFAKLTQKLLLDQYTPASVLINRNYEVLYFHGPTHEYIAQPTGEPTRDLLTMARQGLRSKIRTAVMQAVRENKTATVTDARVKRIGKYFPCNLTVQPIQEPKEAQRLLLVTFDHRREAATTSATNAEVVEESALVRQLDYELKTTREDLQATIEEMEGANEELNASNEEVMSMNEELQSANEELETSKEELQSLNEELTTVNTQLHEKLDDLDEANCDITNLLTSTDIATIFLDHDMRIKRFTPATAQLLNIIGTDIGRPLSDFSSKFTNEELLSDAACVTDTLMPLEKEIITDDGQCYLRRILPYRTTDNRIEGVVITFVDITERKQVANIVNEARLYAEGIIQTVREPLLVLDGNQRVKSANASFYETFHAIPQDTENRLLYELGNSQWDIPQLRTLIERVLPKHTRVVDYEVTHDFEQIGERTMLLNALTLRRDGERAGQVLLAIEDVTERKQAERQLIETRDRYSDLYEFAPVGYVTLDRTGTILEANQTSAQLLNVARNDLIGVKLSQFVDRQFQNVCDQHREEVFSTGSKRWCEVQMRNPDGAGWVARMETTARPSKDGAVHPCRTALSDVSQTVERIRANIQQRMGVCPSFFTLSKETPQIVEHLWRQAEFAYLDNPIPALFKEKLFVYLSRFCSAPYSVARHCAFVLLRGRPAGDPTRAAMPVEDVLQMLEKPLPTNGQLEPHFELLAATPRPMDAWPELGSPLEAALFDCAVPVFLRDREESRPLRDSGMLNRIVSELHRTLGAVWFDHLMTFLTFVRTAHFWSEVHPELMLESDVQELLNEQHALAAWLSTYQETVAGEIEQRVRTDLTDLKATHQSLRKSHGELHTQLRTLEALVNGLGDGVWVVDENCRFLQCNGAAERILGLRGTEKPPDQWPQHYGAFRPDQVTPYPADELPLVRALRGDSVAEKEIFYRNAQRPDGVWCQVSAAPLIDETGAIRGGVCVFRDNSEEIALRAEVLQSADEQDRRIGQELHDNTGQQLMGLGLLAENLADALAEKSPAEGQTATRIAHGLGESLKDVRLLSQRLIPVELDSRGLMSALNGLASRTNALREIECVFECHRPVEILNSFCATNLYRIAQEAISNALKHSDASNITVRLEVDGGSVHLSIFDDGVGIGEQAGNKGMGLRIMKYRAKLMGAQFACGPADGGGTLVTCALAGASGR